MSVRVVHFGADHARVVSTLRQNGYQIDEAQTSIERLNSIVRDSQPDALVVSEHVDIAPIEILSSILQEQPSMARILFHDVAGPPAPDFFDLVIPASCPALAWLPRLKNLTEKSSALRSQWAALQSQRAVLLSNARRAMDESAEAQFHSGFEVERSQMQREHFQHTWEHHAPWLVPRKAGWARTLIVDDHCAFREKLTHLLEGYVGTLIIGEAEDGLEGLRKAEELEPDLILLDIGLPLLDGFEAARRIRRSIGTAKIIFITAYSDLDFIRTAFEIGVEGYLFKNDVGRCLKRALDAVLQGGHYISSQA